MFTIPSLDDIFNHLVPLQADDFRVRQQSVLMEDLNQLCPEFVDGSRQVLWQCQGCSSAWWQVNGTHAELQLSRFEQTLLGHRLHAPVQPDGALTLLPRRLCPTCLGGRLMLGAYPDRLGLKIVWRSDSSLKQAIPRSPTLPYLLVAPLEWLPSEAHHSLERMSEQALSWLVDEPSDLDSSPLIARWLDTAVLIPRHRECKALHDAALVPVRHLAKEDGKRWHGYAWDVPPLLSMPLTSHRLLIVIATLAPHEEPSSPQHLATHLPPLLDRVFQATGWERH